MEINTLNYKDKRGNADLIVLCYFKRKKKIVESISFKEFSKERAYPIEQGDFSAKEGEMNLIYLPKAKEKRCILLGLGEEEKISLDKVRTSFGKLAAFCRGKKYNHCQIVLPKLTSFSIEEVFRAVFDGVSFANYHFDLKLRHEEKIHLVKKFTFIGIGKEGKRIGSDLDSIFSGINLTRDLINDNADTVTPKYLAKVASEIGRSFSTVKTTVLDKAKLKKEKMGLLLAVNQGSAHEPALIVMEYKGNPRSKDRTVIVGKGITFDTGGLNLKPTGGIEDMKTDMSGAATVLGIIKAAAKMRIKANVTGVIAATENAIGSKSYKPGDVHNSKAGISVEITNTDAEGRLVLADALAYAVEHLNPTRIIDFATLTGAIVVALGNFRSGLFTNDLSLKDAIEKAGESIGEKVWAFPLDPEYKKLLKSDIADIKNSGKRKAGSITAATFLKEFVKKVPWAHIDIAGVAYLDEKFYHTSPATGYGVRLFLETLRELYAL